MSSPLLTAVRRNDIATVKSLLARGALAKARKRNVNAEFDEHELLREATYRGSVEIVALLLDAGVYIDDTWSFENTVCHVAVRRGHIAVVELLIARNANLTLRNRLKEMPVTIAIDEKKERLVMLLFDAAVAAGTPVDDDTVCRAATVSIDIIRWLLFKHRVNLGAIRDTSGLTPLHLAVQRKSDTTVLKMLIEAAGIDVNARDNKGRTTAHIACSSRNADAFACLIAAGANLDLADHAAPNLNLAGTPLHDAVLIQNDEIATVLLAAGASIEGCRRE